MLSIVAAVCLLTAQAPGPGLTARDSAFHALNRLAYGARPREADSVAKVGVMRWIEQQLDADHISDSRLAQREHEFKILHYDRGDLAERFRRILSRKGEVGRALRLIQQNVGGALPGIGAMANYGGMRYTNAVFAEDEENLPAGWPPLARCENFATWAASSSNSRSSGPRCRSGSCAR